MVARGLAPKVTFTGYVPPEHLPGYYAACAVYCSPAIGLESFGIVLLEAMAAGRPVVASDIPGYRNVITHGTEGLCFVPKNSVDLACGLVQILQDRQLQKRMGEAGRSKAVRFDWQKITQAVHAYYLEVMERERAERTPA
jgi:phosphatidylinositol alpha-mannosyltransferase